MMSENDWVTLGTYNWLQEAVVIKGGLESAGIPCHIPEENTASINPMATGMQVRVQVEASRLVEAKEFLRESQAASKALIEPCATCGSRDFVSQPPSGWDWLAAIAGLLATIPLRRTRGDKRCAACGKKRKTAG